MPAKAAESRTLAARLPLDLYDALTAAAEREGVSLNRALVTALRSAIESVREPTDDAGQRFVVRRLADADGLLPYLVIDRHYQFGQRSFGTREEAQRVAEEWDQRYAHTPEPQPALVG